ncbi:MAG: hypothetical protein QN163_09795 [Armatimonadota bacterium]|nr:hypothetical protein [Armatimonadota bacterium]MDR5697478.1 hypothetical protein [Armatimonadota bacterium]
MTRPRAGAPAGGGRQAPDGANFLAALLLRFPQLSSASFDPATGAVRLVLLLSRRLSAAGFAAFRRRLQDSVGVLHELSRFPTPEVTIRRMLGPQFTRIEITRSVEDLTAEEVQLICDLVADAFGADLAAGEEVAEDLDAAEEDLQRALEHVRERRPARAVVGVRERGQVLVYYAGRRVRDG